MYKAVKKTKVIQRYMESLSLQTGAPPVHWEDKIICIYVVEDKIVTPRVKNIEIHVCFLQEQLHNGLFITKYQKYSVMPSYIFTKPCSGPIIIRINKLIIGFIFYPTSDTEH